MPRVSPLRPNDPARLGPYRLTGRLGSGGQGVVYLGHDPTNRQVAVKTLHESLVDEPQSAEAFTRELVAAQKVAPFCTAQILDADIGPDRPYIVSEYIDGPSLYHAVREEGPRQGGELHRLAVATATALVAIHEANVVHRDLKPHNVLLGPDGPRVIDFGIARALDGNVTASTSRAIGTPAYMAPEQLAGQRVGPPADVFSWGGVMTFAATGQPAFGADSLPAIITRITQGEPNLDGFSGALGDLVHRCFSKDPLDRPTARQVLDQLLDNSRSTPAAVIGPAGHAAAPTPPGQGERSERDEQSAAGARSAPSRRSRQRRLIAVAAVAGIIVVAAALTAVLPGASPTSGASDAGTSPPITQVPPYTTKPATPRPSKTKTPARTPKSGTVRPPSAPNPQPSGKPPGKLLVFGCEIRTESGSCPISITARGGPVQWRVTSVSPDLDAFDSGRLAAGQTATVTVQLVGSCPESGRPKEGTVSFAPAGTAPVTWNCLE